MKPFVATIYSNVRIDASQFQVNLSGFFLDKRESETRNVHFPPL